MGYKFNGQCLETVDDFYQAFALNCTGQIVTGAGGSVGYVSKCTPGVTGVTVRQVDLSTGSAVGTNTLLQPPLISCTYSSSPGSLPIEDIVALSWLVAGVWVVAWGVKKIIQVIKQR